MPQDVQRNNNLSISNVEQWKPPTDPINTDSWKPPTEPINTKAEEPSFAERVWKGLSTAPKFITDAADKAADYLDPVGHYNPISAFGAGALQGASKMLSPLNVGLTALGAGEGALVSKIAGGAEDLIPTLLNVQKLRQLASMPMVGEGAQHLLSPGSSLSDRLQSIPEIAGGLAGTFGGKFARIANEPTGPKLLGPAPEGTSTFIGGNKGVAENRLYTRDTNAPYNIQHPEGGTVTLGDLGERVKISPDVAATYGLKPDFITREQEANHNKTRQQTEHQDLEERIFKMAQEKFNMGKPLNELEQKILDRAKPQAMRVPIPGQARDNIAMGGADPRVLDVIGTALYTKPRVHVVTKELLQNAFDELRSTGSTKPVVVGTISYDDHPITGKKVPSLTVRDFGRGLQPDQLYTVFTNLGETGKAGDDSASGGFGFAKAAPMLGGEYFEAESIVKDGNRKIKYTFKGTPSELKNQKKGVPLDMIVLDKDTKTQTGLKVKTYFREHASVYQAEDTVRNIAQNSPSITAPIIFNGTYDNSPKFNDFIEHPENKKNYLAKDAKKYEKQPAMPEQAKISIPGADVGIHFENDPQTTTGTFNIHILNKGLYQNTIRTNYPRNLDNAPKNIVADIHANVEEGNDHYPFGANREQIADHVRTAIDEWIKKNIISGAQEKHKKALEATYARMGDFKVTGTKRKSTFFDPGLKLTPEETAIFHNSPVTHQLVRFFDDIIDSIVKGVDKEYKNNDRAEKLEGVGLYIGPERHYGLHIPNPEKPLTYSSILINPFAWMTEAEPAKAAFRSVITALHEVAHISDEEVAKREPVELTDWDDPRVGQFMEEFLAHKREQGGINAGHDMDFIQRLGEVFETYGASNTFDSAEILQNLIADKHGNYHAEVEKLLSIYTEARGRTATTTDVLSSTGLNQKSSKGASGSDGSSNKTNRKRTSPEQITDVVDKLTQAIVEAMPKRAEQENMYSMERAKRIARAEKIVNPGPDGELKNPGLEGFYKQKSVLKEELPKVDYSGLKLNQSDVDTLIDSITLSEKLLPFEKIRAKVGLLKILDGNQGVPQNNELNLLRQVYGASFDKIVEMHGGLGGPLAKKVIMEVANAPKAIMASIDLSAPMRQGLPLIHKKQFWSSIGPMIDSFASTKNFEALQQSLHERPYFLLGKEAGLKLTEVGNDPTHREEAYGSNLANMIPGVKRSEQAYVGFLNKLRADTFDSLIDNAKAEGLHPKDVMHEIAKFVNNATGRGSLGRFDKVATELNTFFFSPRLIASRLTILNPNYYVKSSPFVRKEALKSLLAIAGAGLTINSLLSMFGSSTNTTLSDNKGTSPIPGVGHGIPYMPTNADFMKSRFGHTRVDPYGGFQQYIVAAGRLLSGETASSVTGKVSKLGQGFNSQTRLGVVGNFFENKLSPAASLVDVILKGKDFEGNPTNVPAEIANRFKPMFLNDLYEIYKDDPSHLPLGMASAIGMGVQTYAPPAKKGMTLRVH